jgi:hypothetical protein
MPAMILAVGEVPSARLGTWWHFGEHQALFGDRLLAILVLGRVKDVDPAGDDGDRAGGERAVVRRAVDSASEAGHDRQSILPQIVR